MTDIVDISWPEGMNFENVSLKPGRTQGRDEFGNGTIIFDKGGKIAHVDIYPGNVGQLNGAVAQEQYRHALMTYSGVANLNDIELHVIRGQLIAPFLTCFPGSNDVLNYFYRFNKNALGFNLTLEESKIADFEKVVRKLESALALPLEQPMTLEDLVDLDNPLLARNNGRIDKAYWLTLYEELRYCFQKGEARESEYSLWDSVDQYKVLLS